MEGQRQLQKIVLTGLILSIVVRLTWARPGAKQCVMYDVCGYDPDDDIHPLSCVYNGPPRPLEEENLDTIDSFCPEITDAYGDELCCSGEQVVALANSLAWLQDLIGKCPSCYHNLRQIFCQLTCSPYQAKFTQVNETVEVDDDTILVRKIDVMVMEDYARETYESCKNVVLAGSSSPIMEFLCGNSRQPAPSGEFNCSAHRWLNYMGSTQAGFTSFPIQFRYIQHASEVPGFIPFKATTVPCHQIHQYAEEPCSCLDCPSVSTCPPYEKKCVMYDKCGHQPDNGYDDLNCAYDGPPQHLKIGYPGFNSSNEQLFETFNFLCPDLLTEYGRELCCSASQVKDLVRTLSYYHGILGHCPSCWYNFRHLYCNVACSPYQHLFLSVNETIKNPSTKKDLVQKLNVFIAEGYVRATHQSCHELLAESPLGVPVQLLCGTSTSRGCTPHEWFDFMGRYSTEPSNGFTTYDIQFTYVPEFAVVRTNNASQVKIPFDVRTFTCSEIPPRGGI